MIIHNFNPIFIDLGFFQVKWYSIAYIFGILIGWAYAKKIIKNYEKEEYKFETIKSEEFEFTSKVNDPFSKLIYFSDFTAEFIAYDCYDYARYRRFYVKCID